MTIVDQHSTCSPDVAEARTHRVDDTVAVYLRAHEAFLGVRVGVEAGQRCMSKSCHHKPVVEVWTAWDHRITSDYCRGGAGTWELGEDRFPSWRHADGTGCGMDDLGQRNPDGSYSPAPRYAVFPWERCGSCGSFESIDRTLEAYGDRTRCVVCGTENYYSIGD